MFVNIDQLVTQTVDQWSLYLQDSPRKHSSEGITEVSVHDKEASGRMVWFAFMVFSATFNNISVISWRSVLLMEETGVHGENHSQITDKLYHIMLYTSPWSRFEVTTSVVIGTDCRIGNCKSNYHPLTTTATPLEGRHYRDLRA